MLSLFGEGYCKFGLGQRAESGPLWFAGFSTLWGSALIKRARVLILESALCQKLRLQAVYGVLGVVTSRADHPSVTHGKNSRSCQELVWGQ
ncbi:hypothetical protein MPNT_240011 [Candidatus Methylacidithermus pantelleriae]|uniref:Uncharacterized protein n=1 Tax=Candidatus Methylacidithermus pantelleriae TaxID=2744239 RepID=A0A8J2BP13_9BACT|nr:hypothetical protein MPNT_240011 [Candidatus Methylacidithermus pantelleriae]